MAININVFLFFINRSGNFYKGNWKNSRRHGNGTMHWIKRGEKYNGEWKDGVQVNNNYYYEYNVFCTSDTCTCTCTCT